MGRARGLPRPPPRALRAQFSSQVAGNCLREKILAPAWLSPRTGRIGSEEEGCACGGGNGGQLGVGGWGTHIIEWVRPRVTRSTRTTSNMPARNYLPALCRTVRSRNLCVLKVTPAKVNLTQAEFQQQHVPINWPADLPADKLHIVDEQT